MSIPHIPHWQHVHVLCVCVCASLCGDVCVTSFCMNFSVLSQVHAYLIISQDDICTRHQGDTEMS